MIAATGGNAWREKPRLDTTRLQKMAQAYWESAALMAAVELEVFTAIAHGHDTVPRSPRPSASASATPSGC